MKIKISFGFLLFSVLLFLCLYIYTETNLFNSGGYFNYHISNFLGYLFYWSITLFVISLFALSLDQKKYKMWGLFTFIYVLISILIAYGVGDGNGAIVSFDGKDLTWFFAGLYSLASIIYFAVQHFRKR